MAKKRKYTKSNSRGNTRKSKHMSNIDLTICILIVLSILLGFLIYTNSGVIGVKLNETLDQKYPLTKGIKLKEKKERFENFCQFFSIYWWMIFPIFGFITWFISFFNSL